MVGTCAVARHLRFANTSDPVAPSLAHELPHASARTVASWCPSRTPPGRYIASTSVHPMVEGSSPALLLDDPRCDIQYPLAFVRRRAVRDADGNATLRPPEPMPGVLGSPDFNEVPSEVGPPTLRARPRFRWCLESSCHLRSRSLSLRRERLDIDPGLFHPVNKD